MAWLIEDCSTSGATMRTSPKREVTSASAQSSGSANSLIFPNQDMHAALFQFFSASIHQQSSVSAIPHRPPAGNRVHPGRSSELISPR